MRVKLLILTTLSLILGVKPVFSAIVSVPIDFPTEVRINETFSFDTTLSNIQLGETYFTKCRLGQSSTTLSEGQTYNPDTDSWLSDTGSNGKWVDMPTITASSDPITFPIQCRVKSGSISGQKVLYSSACLKRPDGSCGTSFKSSSDSEAIFTAMEESIPSPSPTASPTSTPAPSSVSTPSPTSSFSVSNTPSQIDSTEEFSVNVSLSISKSPNTIFYLKGAFKKQDKTNYFGLTKINGSWIRNNKSYLEHVKITTDSDGFWSGNLEIQPDILDSGYEGAGEYVFKVGRYTESGSLSWSNETIITISAQEVNFEEYENGSSILGITKSQKQQNPITSSNTKREKYSLEKYIKVATPSSTKTATPSAEISVKNQKQTNPIVWIGAILIFAGVSSIGYIYLKSNGKIPFKF